VTYIDQDRSPYGTPNHYPGFNSARVDLRIGRQGPSPYAGQDQRAIKALSDALRDTYLEAAMMNDMMNSVGMMWGMGLVGLLLALVLILAAAALIKYLFFR
jgi:hypothetical protein